MFVGEVWTDVDLTAWTDEDFPTPPYRGPLPEHWPFDGPTTAVEPEPLSDE